jgi:ATP-dependent Clp protease ATP-binding subunit ClpA
VKWKLNEQGISIMINENVMKYIANKGYLPEFGACPLKRLIQKDIVNELAKKIISGKFRKEDSIVVDI